MWFRSALVDATPSSDATLHSAYRLAQTNRLAKLSGKMQSALAHHSCCLDDAAPLTPYIGPTTHQQQPVLYQHPQQLGIYLTHDAPLFAATPLVYPTLAL